MRERQAARTGWGLSVAAVAAVLALHAADGRAQWLLDAQAERLHDSNLTRAQKRSDVQEDGAWRVRGSAGRLFELGERSDAVARAELAMTRYDTYSGISTRSFGWSGALRTKLGTGLTQPRLEIGLAGTSDDARNSLRDIRRKRLYVAAGRRFSERWDGRLSLEHSASRQRNDFPRVLFYSDKAFDTIGRTLSAAVNYAPSGPWLVGFAGDLRRGDVVSSTRRNPEIFRAANAIVADPAFGPDFVAYRLSGASTRSASFTFSRASDKRSSLDGFVTLDRTKTRSGLQYEGLRIGVSYVYSR